MLLDIWVQIYILSDLIQDVIDHPVVNDVLCCMILNSVKAGLQYEPILV